MHKRIFDQIAQCKTGILKKRLRKIYKEKYMSKDNYVNKFLIKGAIAYVMKDIDYTGKYERLWKFYLSQTPNLLETICTISTWSLPYNEVTRRSISVYLDIRFRT